MVPSRCEEGGPFVKRIGDEEGGAGKVKEHSEAPEEEGEEEDSNGEPGEKKGDDEDLCEEPPTPLKVKIPGPLRKKMVTLKVLSKKPENLLSALREKVAELEAQLEEEQATSHCRDEHHLYYKGWCIKSEMKLWKVEQEVEKLSIEAMDYSAIKERERVELLGQVEELRLVNEGFEGEREEFQRQREECERLKELVESLMAVRREMEVCREELLEKMKWVEEQWGRCGKLKGPTMHCRIV